MKSVLHIFLSFLLVYTFGVSIMWTGLHFSRYRPDSNLWTLHQMHGVKDANKEKRPTLPTLHHH